jgi:CheY-like chemotaxis protein
VFNAVDAMPEGGELTLRTRRVDPGEADGRAGSRLEVEDTGVGMDEETRRRCLEPFFTTKGDQGTGMGLAMVSGILQRHGAQIDIQSEVGGGTIVGVRFQGAPDAQPVAVPDASTPAAGKPIRHLRILVIDDDPLVLQTLQVMLGSGGDHVVAANSGQAGIDAFAAARSAGEEFSVVFTDLGMPHVDGRRVARAVKQMSPATMTVLLTGWGAAGVEGERDGDVDLVMSKPPKLRELREVLAGVRSR